MHYYDVYGTKTIDSIVLHVKRMANVESIEAEFNIKVWQSGSSDKMFDKDMKYVFTEDTGCGSKLPNLLDNTTEVTIIVTIRKWVVKSK